MAANHTKTGQFVRISNVSGIRVFGIRIPTVFDHQCEMEAIYKYELGI
jgi:hypothetical protein